MDKEMGKELIGATKSQRTAKNTSRSRKGIMISP